MIAALAHLAGGCRPESPARGASAGGGASAHAEPSMVVTPTDSLRLEIEVPPEVPAGALVPITLRVRNAGAAPLELYLQGRPVAFDITVARADGSVVWRRLQGKTVLAILQVRVLAPGESLELHDQWEQRANSGEPVGPGSYTVEGALLTDSPQPLKTRAAPLRILLRER